MVYYLQCSTLEITSHVQKAHTYLLINVCTDFFFRKLLGVGDWEKKTTFDLKNLAIFRPSYISTRLFFYINDYII